MPLFIKNMTFKDQVSQLLNDALLEKPSIFLIDLSISDSYKIIVTLDGDNGVALQDCIDISKAIDNTIDREETDYALEVASVGVGSPLKLIRQYLKNIGRTLIVKTKEETIEGELVTALQNVGFTFNGIILNPGAYTHTSIAIGDAVAAINSKVIEVHISNIFGREEFRKHSFVSAKCVGVISGLGLKGYELAANYLMNYQK